MRRSKTNPMAGPRCGAWPSEEVRIEAVNSSSLLEDLRPFSNDRRSIVRIVVCLWGGRGMIIKQAHRRSNRCSPCGEGGEKFLSDVGRIYFRLEVFESEATEG